MKRLLTIVTAGLLFGALSLQAQDGGSTNRIDRQHQYTGFQKGQMKQSESSILAALDGTSVGMQRSAIQTVRDLAQMVPDYPFSSLIAPLAAKLKDETVDPVVRRLAALALDELHSDAGDAVIRDVAEKCDDKGLQLLCEALLVRSNLK